MSNKSAFLLQKKETKFLPSSYDTSVKILLAIVAVKFVIVISVVVSK